MKYDDVFDLWLTVVREWMVDVLWVMDCSVEFSSRCCCNLCGFVNGASPVRFVLSLLYMCVFQINQVCCVVTSDLGLLFVYEFVTGVGAGVCLCMCVVGP